MKHYYRNAGFTLAELLAVIIIVGLLSALSLGYYSRSVEQSRFAEGLSIASAVSEALNQFYLEQQINGVSPTARPTIASLDVKVANQGTCTELSSTNKKYCLATPHFRVYIATTGGVVRAYRGSTSSYKYYIDIQPSFAVSKPNQVACVGKNQNGKNADSKAFCESMGYTDCNIDNECLKCMKTTGSCWN
ncbi:MAG: prepilin-type N-terminal cleavage/methylation domain-containing protein [Elusimicrobiaceae bacterium]|nr:prepilin-type N-terminal cleavage/methylation domain-containing protein [Elusimicrobiaceae bacterium]